MADFKDLSGVIAILFGSGGIGGLWILMNEVKENTHKINDLLNEPIKGKTYVEKKRKKLLKSLKHPMIIILQFICILFLSAFVCIIYFGPEIVLNSLSLGPLAEPLTVGAKIIYWIILFLLALIYIASGFLPWFQGWRAYFMAGKWLRANISENDGSCQ
jgi:hypothetical protein